MSANVDLNQRPDYDAVLQDIADYVLDYRCTKNAKAFHDKCENLLLPDAPQGLNTTDGTNQR
ncbi:hypothetical protein P4112_30390, partial [Pseudomonas aeruginosa]|nr:hypothetical protein [Pseudomonas aeruginosa]